MKGRKEGARSKIAIIKIFSLILRIACKYLVKTNHYKIVTEWKLDILLKVPERGNRYCKVSPDTRVSEEKGASVAKRGR